ncbi:MAG: MBL fold metallo-hydrolase [Candidatus Binatus sp.]|uniref:MBL fold metallo-hydrolase n=1 Tax=Candidatus Binatus sp. TaxID=2811406 RepID=UPI002721D64A|nr:MBL fold metallo-hydrolase [Candidatus Binatus sp.]MDO8431193.1 MBL fold metallo-hydrolase [Candidatus Binatus sp.]
MASIAPIDKVEIHVLVDNATDSLSSTPAHAESEFAFLERHGMRELSGDCLCCACHGLSLLITATRGAHRHTVLFDTGPEEYAFERNSMRLGVDLGTVESIVLSHGHWDHAGGMLKALDLIRNRNGGRAIPYYAHPGMFRSRARRLPNGTMFPMKDVPAIEALTAHGAQVNCTREPQVFVDSMFYLSGEIPRVTPFERGLPAHYQKTEEGQWMPDPMLIDERFLMVNVAGKGLVVFTACSHAGLVNVLKHARDCAPGVPLYAVLGGFHLSGPNEKIIAETVQAVSEFSLRTIAAGHCTGWRAVRAFANAVGETVVDPSVVGKRYTF